jgi:predicted hotdog family 3-hydroxylacyl-ACP dehydratase
MQLIDSVAWFDEETLLAMTKSHLNPDNPLRRRDGSLPITIGIEIAAQATAIHGALILNPAQRTPRPGMLVLGKHLEWSRNHLDDIQESLIIKVVRQNHQTSGAIYDFSLATQNSPAFMKGRLGVFFEGTA